MHYKICSNILHEKVGNDTIVANLDNDKMYDLNESGSVLWEQIFEGKSYRQIKNHISNNYKVNEEIVTYELDEMINSLIDEGLIERGDN